MVGRLWVFALVLGGCYEQPTICGITCETACPEGFTCTDHRCLPADGTACSDLPQTDFAEVHAGAYFACARDVAGAIYCWGDNHYGQIGQTVGAVAYSTPTKIGDGFSALSVGAAHACGLRDGNAVCWGDNQQGQVQGGTGGTLPPTQVGLPAGAPAFTQISAGGNHTCAIGSDGSLWCWGSQTSIGVTTIGIAQEIGTDHDWTSVAAGIDHVCGIRSDGVYCFGKNDYGQVQLPASGSVVSTPARISVGDGTPPLFVEAGQYVSCAILGVVSGPLYCWGLNEGHYQIRQTAVTETLPPTQVGSDVDWTAVRAGRGVSCGLRAGNAYCWGYATQGGLGGGYWDHRYPYGDPAMQTLGPADEIDLNTSSPDNREWSELGCLHHDAKIACWGRNQVGQLGLGTVALHLSPVEIVSPATGHAWQHVWAGREHLCATTDDSQVWCWGADTTAQVSAGVDRGDRQPCIASQPCDFPKPTLAPPAAQQASTVVTGNDYSCALTGANVVCWGQNGDGLLGVSGTTTHGPTSVIAPSGAWSLLSGGDRGTCGKTTAGAAPACWGRIGHFTYGIPQAFPDAALQNTSVVSFGDDFGCAVAGTSRVCWGENGSGQFGNGNMNDNDTPTLIDSDTLYVSARAGYACKIAASDGTVSCAGYNPNGQVGKSPSGNEPNLTSVTDMNTQRIAGCTKLGTASDHACALCGGTVKCWGERGGGRTGSGISGSMIARQFAVDLDLPGTTLTDLAVHNSGGCAIDTDGKLWCWGESGHGQNGDGGQDRNIPTEITR